MAKILLEHFSEKLEENVGQFFLLENLVKQLQSLACGINLNYYTIFSLISWKQNPAPKSAKIKQRQLVKGKRNSKININKTQAIGYQVCVIYLVKLSATET